MTVNNTIAKQVCNTIAPLWPLKNYVAVNPYLGFSTTKFHETARLLAKRSSIRMTLPLEFYLGQFESGKIKREHLEAALSGNQDYDSVKDLLEVAKAQLKNPQQHGPLKTVINLLDNTGELEQMMKDSISRFTAAYFDDFQAIWKTDRNGLLTTWLQEASIDRTPQLAGINGFRQSISDLPANAEELIEFVSKALQLDLDESEAYYHTVLLKLSGWASYLSGIDWDNNLYSTPTMVKAELLSILLSWEYAAYKSFNSQEMQEAWKIQKAEFNKQKTQHPNLKLDLEIIFQEAFDLSHQEELIEKINSNIIQKNTKEQAAIQSIFCIDVRSELIRRNIESINPNIETIGFAGFFGMPIKYKSTPMDESENLCPVLIPSGPIVTQKFKDEKTRHKATSNKTDGIQFDRTWKSYKSGTTSAFGFVSLMGVFFLPKLVKRSLFLRNEKDNKVEDLTSQLDLSGIPLEDKISMAANALTRIGLKNKLSELVMVVGHGSTSTNNPHATGLDCGACGGHSGAINARTFAQIVNEPKVREGLGDKGIKIPDSTLFVACLHDTTSDEIKIFTPTLSSSRQQELLEEAKESFSKAAVLSRSERALRFPEIGKSKSEKLSKRGKDWSQVRPEWGLAGCSSFIIGDRSITKNINLEGKAFLHNYDSKTDKDKATLETIITAPMVVTSWINLQYYASVTDNKNFGTGNKTLHNITSGIGVIEGLGGDLKTGLSFQSLHDGKNFQHLPYKLKVFVQASTQAINKILEKHPSIQDLFDNNWIKLYHINEFGKVTQKYQNNLNWETLSTKEVKTIQSEEFEPCIL